MASLLPQNMQDDSNIALEKCAAKALDVDMAPLMIYLIDRVDAKLLPLIAENFHITGDEGWNFCTTEQEKRELLKSAIPLHQYKGTKYAVLRVLEVLNLQGSLEQWFEYDGIPHHFRVIIKVFDKSLDEEIEKKLIKLITIFKNKRAILDKIEMYLTSKVKIRFYPRMLIGEVITIKSKKENQ